MKFMARFPPDTGSRWTRSGFIEHPSHTPLHKETHCAKLRGHSGQPQPGKKQGYHPLPLQTPHQTCEMLFFFSGSVPGSVSRQAGTRAKDVSRQAQLCLLPAGGCPALMPARGEGSPGTTLLCPALARGAIVKLSCAIAKSYVTVICLTYVSEELSESAQKWQQKPHQRGLALGMSPQPRSLSAAGVRTLHMRPPLQCLLKHVPLTCSSLATCVEQKKQNKLNPQPLAHPAAAPAWSAPRLHKPSAGRPRLRSPPLRYLISCLASQKIT